VKFGVEDGLATFVISHFRFVDFVKLFGSRNADG